MICSKGHNHNFTSGYRYCATDGCVTCTDDDRPCDVVALLDGAAADCHKTLLALPDVHLSGFEHRAASALVHLREAWCNADPSNRPGISAAIVAVLSTRTVQEQSDKFAAILSHGMATGMARRLFDEAMSVDPRALTASTSTDADRDAIVAAFSAWFKWKDGHL